MAYPDGERVSSQPIRCSRVSRGAAQGAREEALRLVLEDGLGRGLSIKELELDVLQVRSARSVGSGRRTR